MTTAARRKYLAGIRVDGKRIHLGSFRTLEEAESAYLTAKRQMHPGFVEADAA